MKKIISRIVAMLMTFATITIHPAALSSNAISQLQSYEESYQLDNGRSYYQGNDNNSIFTVSYDNLFIFISLQNITNSSHYAIIEVDYIDSLGANVGHESISTVLLPNRMIKIDHSHWGTSLVISAKMYSSTITDSRLLSNWNATVGPNS